MLVRMEGHNNWDMLWTRNL